ncbi:MAG: TonB-dependent siderophore receptor [Flavisolibacter sp.]
MRKFLILALLLLNLNAFAQEGFVQQASINVPHTEIPAGVITGQVFTTDEKPAAFVSIQVKENNKTALSDENGWFTIRNLKEGSYTIEVTMVGLKPKQQTVNIRKDQTVHISITLEENAKQLSDVVVTSGRRLNNKPVAIGKIAINPMDLPQSLAVVGQGLIRDQQAQRLGDVIKNVNGVYVSTTRGNVQESFGARGYSFGSTNLFKNGARINSGSMPEMSAIERVEVLKGSSAILFGQVAPGGIINMVTKQPRFDRGGSVSMRVGSYNLYKPAFDIYGPLSGAVAYRLNGTYENAGSFRDQVSSERFYLNPSFLFKPGKHTEIILEGDYLHHDFTPDFGIGSLDNTKIPDVPRSRFMGTAWQYSKTRQATATATIRHQLNEEWKINSSFSYQFYKRDYFSTERIQAAANGDWNRPLGRILTDENYYTGQVNLEGDFKTASLEHKLLAGVDADRTVTANNDFSFPEVNGLPARSYDRINILDPDKYVQRTDIPEATRIRQRIAPSNRAGIYLQDLVKISGKFNVLAGIRYSYLKTLGIDSTNILTGEKTSGTIRTESAFSPRVGLVYKPFKTTSVFASYANSFVINSGQDLDGNTLDPSIIDQYELGVKNEFFNGLFSANLTLYRIVNNNLAQTAPFLRDGTPNNLTSIKELTGQTTSDGVELDLASHPIKGLDITAGYSYNFARYTKTAGTRGSYKTGERLVNSPAHTGNASLFYTFSGSALKGLKLGASVFYIGERVAGWNNTVGQAQTYSRMILVEGFTTVDISAGYTLNRISLMAKVSNLTNALNYYVHENYSVNPIPPRQLIATLSYKF